MGNRKLKTCFISAPVGVDTRPLREALVERGVTVRDASDLLSGSRIPRTAEEAIADADFLCAVIPASLVASNVYFEIGVAVGIDRPCLLFVEPSADLPIALQELPYARSALTNAGALSFHLDAFLKNAGKSGERREVGRGEEPAHLDPVFVASALDRLAAWEAQSAPPHEGELVSFLAEVFEAAGYVTSTALSSNGMRGARPDLAVWIDELQSTIGNPLSIEVVTKHPAEWTNVRHFMRFIRDLQSTLGLIVFWQLDPSPLPEIRPLPMVVAMSAREVVEAIFRGEFALMLLTRRNALVHSAA